MRLPFFSRRRLVGATVPLMALIISACSLGATAETADNGRAVTLLEPPPAIQQTQAPAATASSLAAFAELDANVIAAANEEVLGNVYEQLLPSVVNIRVRRAVENEGQGRGFSQPFGFGDSPPPIRRGEGSGFVWSAEGHIVTNHHVVDGADRVTVIFADGTEVDAEILGTDGDSDLAVLKVDMPSDQLRPVHLGDSDAVKVGQMAAAIGSPFGHEFTLTSGIVSATGRTISGNRQFSIPEAIQTDAAINPGNSGGPLLDRIGRVIGINSQISTRSGSNAGVGFAVPINMAKRVVPVLIEEGRFEYSFLGVSGATLRSEVAAAMDLPAGTRGALVIAVGEDGPAVQAGLRGSDRTAEVDGLELPVGGDVIVGIDGVRVTEMNDIVAYLVRNTRPGDRVTVDVIRGGGEEDQIEVTLGTRPVETG